MIGDFLDSPLWLITTHFALLSLAAIGGGIIAVAPDMQRYVVDTHPWLSAEAFTIAFTIAQASPGPNFLFVTLIGGQIAGWPGALAATLATFVPPAILTIMILRSTDDRPPTRFGPAIRAGFAPFSVGLMLATGWILTRSADHDWRAALLTAITVIVVAQTKWNPLWLIAVGAVVGIAGWV